MSNHIAAARPTRAVIICRAKQMRTEIESIFNDAAHWNRINPRQKPIDPDPDGTLRRIADSIDTMLEQEKKNGR